MLTIHRHVLATYLRFFSFTIVGALALFTIMDLLDHMGSLVDNHATAGMIARYYLYRAAWIINLVIPIATLMATLFTIGGMARYLELTALFAAGWSLMKVTRPLIIVSLLISLVALSWHEFVLPEANVRRNHVWEVEIHKNPDRIRPTQRIPLIGTDGRRYYAHKFDPNTGMLTGLEISTLDGTHVIERIDAKRAEWDGEHWTLINGTRRVFKPEGEIMTSFERLTAQDLAVDPKSFYHDRIRLEDMSLSQLQTHVKLIRASGGNPTTALADIQFNLAFPLVNLIFTLIGIVLASGPRKTTIASGFGYTLLIGFGYYLFMNIGRSLGHSGEVHPILAAWSGNFFFLLVFWILYLRARR